MLSIKTKLKINQIKGRIIKLYYFLVKPLAILMRKIDNYRYKKKSNKIKRLANELTDEEVIKLIVKDVIKVLIRHPKYEKCFDKSRPHTRDFSHELGRAIGYIC